MYVQYMYESTTVEPGFGSRPNPNRTRTLDFLTEPNRTRTLKFENLTNPNCVAENTRTQVQINYIKIIQNFLNSSKIFLILSLMT